MGSHDSEARGLELLLRLSVELCSQRDLQGVLERTWKELAYLMDAERTSIFLVSEDGNELEAMVSLDAPSLRFPKDRGIAGEVLKTGRPVVVEDAYGDPRFNPEVDRITGFRTRSILSVPLKSPSGELIGVAQVLNKRRARGFNEQDVDLLTALSAVVAVAIENVKLYEEQRRATEAVVAALVTGLEMRTEGRVPHAPLVMAYCGSMASTLGLDEGRVKRVEWSAALHDLGKLSVPDSILKKGEALTQKEKIIYEGHAVKTRELLCKMGFSGELKGIEEIAPYHHKYIRGGGFPPGPPEGDELPLEARILAVGDALWCRMYPRWGEPPETLEQAIDSLRKEVGSKWDPVVVEAVLDSREQIRTREKEAMEKWGLRGRRTRVH